MTLLRRSVFGHQCTYVSSVVRSLRCRSAYCTSVGSAPWVMSVVAKKCRNEWNVPSTGHPAALRHWPHISDQRWSRMGWPASLVNSSFTVRRLTGLLGSGVPLADVGQLDRDRWVLADVLGEDQGDMVIKVDGADRAGLGRRAPVGNVCGPNYTMCAQLPKTALRGIPAYCGAHDRLRRLAVGHL